LKEPLPGILSLPRSSANIAGRSSHMAALVEAMSELTLKEPVPVETMMVEFKVGSKRRKLGGFNMSFLSGFAGVEVLHSWGWVEVNRG